MKKRILKNPILIISWCLVIITMLISLMMVKDSHNDLVEAQEVQVIVSDKYLEPIVGYYENEKLVTVDTLEKIAKAKGVSPNTYKDGDAFNIYINKQNPMQYSLSFDFVPYWVVVAIFICVGVIFSGPYILLNDRESEKS